MTCGRELAASPPTPSERMAALLATVISVSRSARHHRAIIEDDRAAVAGCHAVGDAGQHDLVRGVLDDARHGELDPTARRHIGGSRDITEECDRGATGRELGQLEATVVLACRVGGEEARCRQCATGGDALDSRYVVKPGVDAVETPEATCRAVVPPCTGPVTRVRTDDEPNLFIAGVATSNPPLLMRFTGPVGVTAALGCDAGLWQELSVARP